MGVTMVYNECVLYAVKADYPVTLDTAQQHGRLVPAFPLPRRIPTPGLGSILRTPAPELDRWQTETIKRLCELTKSLLALSASAPPAHVSAALSNPVMRGVLGQPLAERLEHALREATQGRISAPIDTRPTLMARTRLRLITAILIARFSGAPSRARRLWRLHGCLLRPAKAVCHRFHCSAPLCQRSDACASLWPHAAHCAWHRVDKLPLRHVARVPHQVGWCEFENV